MKLPCPVVRDLLPLYAEKLVEPETQALVEAHLEDCPECRQRLSEAEAGAITPVETALPLKALKRELQKRRWLTAAIAALCVFIGVFTFFSHADKLQPVSWEDGLIEVKGIETRPYGEVFGEGEGSEPPEATVDVLVLKIDSRINGVEEASFTDEDGSTTLLLQGWSSNRSGQGTAREYSEQVFCPIPDRLIYGYSGRQQLLWGEPLNGGVEVLPRLALAYYLMLAVILAALSGLAWFLLRHHSAGRVARQVFFAPASYIVAHLLIKGTHTTSFFMERDFFDILLIAAALYALLTLLWQAWLRRKDR